MNNDKQHREDTKYKQWQDGMYVMLDDLMGDYEKALIEDSLRGSVYFRGSFFFEKLGDEETLGVHRGNAGKFWDNFDVKITRAQALYIATGDVDI
jgi:hypothetical protein